EPKRAVPSRRFVLVVRDDAEHRLPADRPVEPVSIGKVVREQESEPAPPATWMRTDQCVCGHAFLVTGPTSPRIGRRGSGSGSNAGVREVPYPCTRIGGRGALE